MPKRKAEQEGWEDKERAVCDLYITQGLALNKVMEVMRKRGFDKTKSQYEEFFRARNISKNKKADDWKHVNRKVRDRDAQKKKSVVRIRNIKIPEKKVRKEIGRYEPTTFERYFGMQQNEEPRTPGYIEITTPPTTPLAMSSPYPQDLTRFHESIEPVTIRGGKSIPWCQFIDAVHQQSFLRHVCLSFRPRRVESINSPGRIGSYTTTSTEVAPANRSLYIPTVDGGVIGNLFKHNSVVHPVHSNSRPYLPPHNDTVIKFDMLGRNAYLEMLKHIILVVSNNLDQKLVHKLVEILANDSYARNVFARIISFDLVTLKACVERIWFPAVEYGNCALVEILVDAGVDLNIRGSEKTYVDSLDEFGAKFPPGTTALQCAIMKGYDDITDLLLARNANDWHAKILHDSSTDSDGNLTNRFKICTLIDLAVQVNNPNLLQNLLDRELSILGTHNSASQYTLCLARLHSRPRLVCMIMESRPGLWDHPQCIPPSWVPTSQPQPPPLDTVKVLQSSTYHASSISATNEPALLSLVSDLKRRGFAKPMKQRHLDAAQVYTIRNLKNLPPGLPALHVAIYGCITPLVTLLLQNGADPRQFSEAYPIQLATAFGSLEMVDILIEHGCEIDAASTDDYWANSWLDLEVDELEGLNLRHPAICFAWRKSRFDIIEKLLNAGATFPVYDQSRIRHDPEGPHYFEGADPTINHEEDERVECEDYFDPWVDAVRFNTVDGLRQIVQFGEKLIGYGMSTAHLARCILIHGTSCTLEFVLNHDLLESKAFRDPLILSALAYIGDLNVAKQITNRLMNELNHATFVQRYGSRALCWAVIKNHGMLIQMFLDSGVNPFAQVLGFPDTDSWRADRWYDPSRNDLEMKYYFDRRHGPEGNLPTENVLQPWGSTPFRVACASRNFQEIKAFLMWELLPNVSDFEHVRQSQLISACLTAVCLGDRVLEDLLLENEINLGSVISIMDASTVATHFRLGLQYALNYRHLQLAKRLLDLGADGNTPAVTVRRTWWETPLQCAAKIDELGGLVKKLLELGANTNESVKKGYVSALGYAASHGNFENVQLLIAAGADIDGSGVEGPTALQLAAANGRLDMAIYLLENGADVEGHGNKNYLESVREAWGAGHRTLARAIHDWKKERFGEEDCESIESIVAPLLSSERWQNSLGHRRHKSSTDSASSDMDSDSDYYDDNEDEDLFIQTISSQFQSRSL